MTKTNAPENLRNLIGQKFDHAMGINIDWHEWYPVVNEDGNIHDIVSAYEPEEAAARGFVYDEQAELYRVTLRHQG